MKLKYVLIGLLSPGMAFGIVHVGNGGGEAEMRVLQMVPSVAIWAQACNDSPGVCGTAGLFTAQDIAALRKPVGFASGSSTLQQCTPQQTTLIHESLYVDNKTPRPDPQLAQTLIGQLLVCGGWSKPRFSQLRLEFLPLAKALPGLPIYILPGRTTDVAVSETSRQSLQAALTQAMSCKQFRFISSDQSFIKLRCLDNGNQYLVQARVQGTEVQFKSRYDSGD